MSFKREREYLFFFAHILKIIIEGIPFKRERERERERDYMFSTTYGINYVTFNHGSQPLPIVKPVKADG